MQSIYEIQRANIARGRKMREQRARRRTRARFLEALGAGAVVTAYALAIVACGVMLVLSASQTADAWAARTVASLAGV